MAKDEKAAEGKDAVAEINRAAIGKRKKVMAGLVQEWGKQRAHHQKEIIRLDQLIEDGGHIIEDLNRVRVQ